MRVAMTMPSGKADRGPGDAAMAQRIAGGPAAAAVPSSPPSRMARLSSWLGGGDGQARTRAAAAEARREAARHLFARIGDFLSTHDLSPTNENFRIARCYVLGEDPRLTRAIDGALQAHGRLAAEFLDSLDVDDAPLSATRIAALADSLTRRLSESERVIRQGQASTRDYNTALTAEADALGRDPGGTVARLIDLTAAAVARTQQLADRLDETRRETESLRSNLREARRVADEDHLTGLPNRRCFETRLQTLVAADPTGAAHCVAICDVDNFKGINDRHGHDTGDRVLRLIGGQLVRELGADVLVARHGGEEFTCLFERMEPAQAIDRLDAAREALAARMLVNQATGEGIGRLTFSAGVAPLCDSPAAAMRAADEALYLAKRRGKNRVVSAASLEPDDMT